MSLFIFINGETFPRPFLDIYDHVKKKKKNDKGKRKKKEKNQPYIKDQ